MKISEAISYTRSLSGNAVDDNTLCRWLSELDGRLMLDFYKGSEWMSYSLPQDEDHELLVPFPWDELYVHYLEAMVYYSNGEFERYRNSYEMYNKKELDYRQWYARNQLPITLAALARRDCTVVTEGRGSKPFWYLSAYSLAVKHGFTGTEEEWLAALRGDKVQLRYNGTDNTLEWKYTEDSGWSTLMELDELQGAVIAATLAQATAAQEAAEQAAKDAAGDAEGAEGSAALAKSWAVGGTGTREGEDADNAKYWSQMTKIADGLWGVRVENGDLIVTYTGEAPPPLSIVDGHLIYTLNDGQQIDVGRVAGAPGANGASAFMPLTETAEAAISITANSAVRVTGQPTALNITLGAPAAGQDNEWRLVFKAGEGFALTDTAPEGHALRWEAEPVWQAGMVYEVSYGSTGLPDGDGNTIIGVLWRAWA